MTPEELLLKAVKSRHYNGIKRAFEAKANVNAPDDIGWTSLQHAAYYGFDEIVDLLLSHDDIDVSAKTPQQETARDLAFLNCHDKIAAKLDAAHFPTGCPSRVIGPASSRVEASIVTTGRPRSLFD
jgi:ankyrin repeat protein